jgi:hypothetical protein
MRLFEVFRVNNLIVGFGQGLNAARAKYFANFPAAFHHRDPLKIRAELAAGCDEGMAAIVTESCLFTTLVALCHLDILSI